MSNYVDLITVKFNNERDTALRYAPFASGVKAGDMVIVEGVFGKVEAATVTTVASFDKDSGEYKLVTAMRGGDELQRVIGVVKPFDYSDDDYIQGFE